MNQLPLFGRSLFLLAALVVVPAVSGCAASTDSSDYAPAPGAGGEAGQLDFTGPTNATGPAEGDVAAIDVGVGKSETLVHPTCSHRLGEEETCDDGRRPIPIDVTAACDDGVCEVDVIPTEEGATLRITPIRSGSESVHVHAERRGGGGGWDDSFVLLLKRAKAAPVGG